MLRNPRAYRRPLCDWCKAELERADELRENIERAIVIHDRKKLLRRYLQAPKVQEPA